MPHLHPVYDTDSHFIVDPETRDITYSGTEPLILIQNDHNSEHYTFEIPRVVDGHDMSLCTSVQVHYINIDSANGGRNVGVYEVKDLQPATDSDEFVIGSWAISQNATQLVGSLIFAIRFACLTGSAIDYVWNTTAYSGVKVSSGIYNGDEIERQYADIIQSWYDQIFGNENDRVEAENKRIENENERIENENRRAVVSEAMRLGIENVVETQEKLLSGKSPFKGALSLLDVYPIGSIYMSVNEIDPSILFGGNWERLKDRFLLGAGDTYSAGETGGEATHKLVMGEMPSHAGHLYGNNDLSWKGNAIGYKLTKDNFNKQGNAPRGWNAYSGGVLDAEGDEMYPVAQSVGENKAHNNMPPYLAVYMWKRIA